MYPAKVNSYQCPGCWGDCGRETKVMRSILDRKHCQKELSLNPYKATHWQLSRLESQVCWDDVGWGMYTADTVYPSPSSFVHACIQSHPSVALQGRGWLQRINKQRLVKQIIISSLIHKITGPKGLIDTQNLFLPPHILDFPYSCLTFQLIGCLVGGVTKAFISE